MAFVGGPSATAISSPYGALTQGYGPFASYTGLTNLSGVVAPGYGQAGLSAADILATPYSGYGNGGILGAGYGIGAAGYGNAAAVPVNAAPNAGYRPAANIPPVSGPTGFNVGGLSSWSGYSAGTVTLAPSASGYGYGAGYQFSGPGGFGTTALPNPIAGGPIFPPQQFNGVAPSVFNNGVPGVLPTTVANTFIPPTATQRVAPPPPTVAPVGYE